MQNPLQYLICQMKQRFSTPMRVVFCGSVIIFVLLICGFAGSVLFKNDASDSSKTKLEFAIVVVRHGSRAPLKFYKDDPYKDPRYWPEGQGALTSLGKLEMFKRGQMLRERYNNFFHQGLYKEKDIYVRTTRITRTYMSCATLMAGMLPPVGEQVWKPDLDWQPIPIWPDTADKSEIVMNATICPRFTEEQQRVFTESAGYVEEHEDLIDYIKQHSGVEVKRLPDFFKIWDPLDCEQTHGLTLPEWTKSIYPDKLRVVASHMFKETTVGTHEMNRLVSGPLLEDFRSWIMRKIEGVATEKMLLHTGHDFTIIGLLTAVGFSEFLIVEPASALAFELYKTKKGYHVEMYYFNRTIDNKPYHLNMPKCRHPCSVENFLKMFKQMVPSDWTEECNSSSQ